MFVPTKSPTVSHIEAMTSQVSHRFVLAISIVLISLQISACTPNVSGSEQVESQTAPAVTQVPVTPISELTPPESSPTVIREPQSAKVVEYLEVEILDVYDRYNPQGSWTQGFEFDGADVIEGTGITETDPEQPIPSELRRLDMETGELKAVALTPNGHYGEGITIVGSRIYQITWQDNSAYVYDLSSFELLDSFTYDGEGWGLCYDGDVLWMSNGSGNIVSRNPDDFSVLSTVKVTLDGAAVHNINELECVGDVIYANIWQTTQIMRIDPLTGRITAVIEASSLGEHSTPARTLNGIAYNSSDNTFLLTGKLWDHFYKVKFATRSDG